MALNDDLDKVLLALPTFAASNTVKDGIPPVTRPMTELEALGVSEVRLVKRYAAAKGLSEKEVLRAVLLRLQNRLAAFDRAQLAAEANVASDNPALVAQVLATITIDE